MKYRELRKLIEQDGWRFNSQSGSHAHFEHPEKKGKVTIAGHPNDDVPPGIVKAIRKQAGLK